MEDLILAKKKLTEFIKKIQSDYTIFAPTTSDNIILYKQIKNPSEIYLDFVNSKVPPKSLLFKQTETLFKFKKGVKAEINPIDFPNSKSVIFGIRPCDAKSFSILDHVFKDDSIDPYYVTKRKNTTLIGLSCTQPDVNCFCTSMNGGPTNSDDVDILLTDIGEKYFVEINNEKGKTLINKAKNLFSKATTNDKKKKQQVEKKSNDLITRNMKTEGVKEKLDKIFENNIWKKISMKCLSCGICTYQCPTCHCFDIQDESTLTDGARIRVWDTCMNPEYTLHASGHNPRPARMNRTRNRVYHKFNYYPKNYNVIACVGCGRCINDCPVNIDIIDIIDQVKEVKA
ncbi:4Fe-4S dicluster domain protein [Thermoplasmatales archaeon SCGC AB-539-N05]|nr:4Fe-4S dicluster domain protein [Thermoplasmatales archaeon SCGC AB-539-N05]ENO12253.1 4Fe-4S dicluster domain protein [Thermoplasmatales archaeon SCGC AB-539-C06]